MTACQDPPEEESDDNVWIVEGGKLKRPSDRDEDEKEDESDE